MSEFFGPDVPLWEREARAQHQIGPNTLSHPYNQQHSQRAPMREFPNAHPGVPLTLWLRPRSSTWFQTMLPDEPDAVEYVRKDVCDAWLERAVNERREEGLHTASSLREVMVAALGALEDNDGAGAELILRTCLKRL